MMTRVFSGLFIILFVFNVILHSFWMLFAYPFIGFLIWTAGHMLQEPVKFSICWYWLPRLFKNLLL